jgi:hypothetical protein
MKEFKDEVKMGPTENKMPTTIRIKHEDLPGIEEAAPGDRVKLVIEGHVHSNRMADDYCDGEAEVDVHSVENVEAVKKENAATMHMDKLKSKLPKKEEAADEEADKKAGVEEKEVESEESDKGE